MVVSRSELLYQKHDLLEITALPSPRESRFHAGFNSKGEEPLNVSFSLRKAEKKDENFSRSAEENGKFFISHFIIILCREGGKRKSHLLYTHSLAQLSAYFNSFSEKFLIAWAG